MNAFLRLLGGKWTALALRFYLGGIFVYASVYKIQYPAEFAETVASYQILPFFLVHPVAVFLPWVELVSGVLLVSGVRAKAAVLTIAGMLAMFTLALVYVLARDIPIGCGCFSTQQDAATWLTVLRDLAWLGMAAHVFFHDRLFHLDNIYSWKIEELSS